MATLLSLLRWLEKQPLHDKEALMKLAHRGWFLGPRMPADATTRLRRAVEDMPDEVDVAVGQHVRRHFDDIEAALIGTYPHRAQLFQEAFGAHRESKYALSIPVFLTQADGIFHERFGKLLFTGKRNAVVSAFSSVVIGRFFQSVLHPLTIDAPLWKSTSSLDDTFAGLNRNQVLHGLGTNYNTELNSLKAISLLDNLHWVLNRRTDVS